MNTQDQIENKQAELSKLNCALENKQNELSSFDLSEHVGKDPYNEMLDEIYKDACDQLPVNVTGSELLKNYDPVGYRCGFNDYIDSLDPSSFDEYKDLEEEIEELEDQICDVECEIEELEEQAEIKEEDQK